MYFYDIIPNRFVVVEIQVYHDGTISHLATSHSDRGEAYQKYHTVLAAAAVSDLPCHSAVIVDASGTLLERGMFERPEKLDPEPEEGGEE